MCGGGGGGGGGGRGPHHDGDDCSWPWILKAVHSANFQLCQDRITR